MVYIVVAVAGLVVAGMIFAGCTVNPMGENSSRFTGLSLTQKHMNFGDCYSFYLREEDGKALFDADVRFNEEPYCIILESCQVDESELERLRNLDKEYSITSYVTAYINKPSLFDVDDKTTNKTTVYLSNGTDKSADTKEAYVDVLYSFFFDLAKKYISKSVYLYEE